MDASRISLPHHPTLGSCCRLYYSCHKPSGNPNRRKHHCFTSRNCTYVIAYLPALLFASSSIIPHSPLLQPPQLLHYFAFQIDPIREAATLVSRKVGNVVPTRLRRSLTVLIDKYNKMPYYYISVLYHNPSYFPISF